MFAAKGTPIPHRCQNRWDSQRHRLGELCRSAPGAPPRTKLHAHAPKQKKRSAVEDSSLLGTKFGNQLLPRAFPFGVRFLFRDSASIPCVVPPDPRLCLHRQVSYGSTWRAEYLREVARNARQEFDLPSGVSIPVSMIVNARHYTRQDISCILTDTRSRLPLPRAKHRSTVAMPPMQ